MPLLPWTTLSCVIVGDGLACALVWGSALGVKVRRGPLLRGFLTMPAEEARRTLADELAAAGGRVRVVLTCPASWCGLRPIALTCARWASAREEILGSIEGFFPLAAGDALVGLIDRPALAQAGKGRATDAGGYLLAVGRSRVQPWLTAIQRALGREADELISAHMALAGLGLQEREEAEIVERLASGASVAHRLRHGEVAELARPWEQEGEVTALFEARIARLRLPDERPDSVSATAPAALPTIDPVDLAVAAALSARVAPGAYRPLIGRPIAAPKRWVLPAAASLAAAGVLWLASGTDTGRYEAALARLEAEHKRSAPALAEAERARSEAIRLAALLEAGVRRPTAEWQSVTPALALAQAAVPEGAFLYRVELDARSVTLKGEAKRASDVLRRLEETPQFRGAHELDTAAVVEERGLELFSIKAERAAPKAPTAATAGPTSAATGGATP